MVSISDDFNRANSTSTLGANWVNRLNRVGINTNAAYASPVTPPDYGWATHITALLGGDFQVDVTVGSMSGTAGGTGDYVYILGGYNSSGVGVIAEFNSGTTVQIYSTTAFTAASLTQRDISSASPTYTAGDILSLKRVSAVYTTLKNNVAISGSSWNDNTTIVPRDSSHALMGCGGYNNNVDYRRLDQFDAADIVYIAPTKPPVFSKSVAVQRASFY